MSLATNSPKHSIEHSAKAAEDSSLTLEDELEEHKSSTDSKPTDVLL